MERRAFLIGAGCVVASPALAARTPSAAFGGAAFAAAVARLELASRGRLGVALIDTATRARFAHRGDEAFALCSTFKLPLAAAVLRRVDRGEETLDRRIAVAARDLVANSPFTERRTGSSATVRELCEAAVTFSDNAAANLLLATMNGPAGLTRDIRAVGDRRTRLDRTEPTLNDWHPGEVRDTTTPTAMAALSERLVIGDALSPGSRAILIGWLVATQTGLKRIRGGIPATWRAGDKTGTGGTSINDVAILWPPRRAPIIVASYLSQCPLPIDLANAVHAKLGALVVGAI